MLRIGPLAPALLLLLALFTPHATAQGLALEDIVDNVQEAFASDRETIAEGANWVLLDSPADTDPELDDRDLVVVVHGFGNDYLELSENIHPTWAGLRFALGAEMITGDDYFDDRKIVYYQYLPTRSFDELGAEFASVIQDNFPGASPIVVAHSAGALLARHASRHLSLKAVIGIAPADHGVQAASFMAATQDLSDLLGEDHAATIEAARDRFEVSDEVLTSLAWDNSDGVLKEEDASTYGIPVGEYPEMNYNRYAHYGVVERFRPDVIQLINDGFEDGAVERDAAEFAALASYDEAWTGNDGVLAPSEGAGEDTETLRYYDDVRHAEMLFNPAVLQAVVEDINSAIGLEPSEPTSDDEDEEDESWMGADGDDESDDEEDAEVAEVSTEDEEDESDDEDDDREMRRKKRRKKRRRNGVNVGTNNGVIQNGDTNIYIESMKVIGDRAEPSDDDSDDSDDSDDDLDDDSDEEDED